MKIPSSFYLGAIAILLAIVFLQRACSGKCPTPAAPKQVTVYIHDRDTFIQKVPVPYQVIVQGRPRILNKTDTLFRENFVVSFVDTLAILADYFATRFYSDTNYTKYGPIVIQDSITQNRIKFRRMLTNFNLPMTQTQNILNPAKNQIYIGLSAGSNGQTIGLGPEFLLKTKLDHIYTIGVDLFPNQPLYYHAGIFWKIHL